MIGLAYSVRDVASRGIFRAFVEVAGLRCVDADDGNRPLVNLCEGGSVRVAGFDEDVIYFEFLDRFFDPSNHDAVIVLSRHRASSGVPSLTVHSTGNPGPQAVYGGNPFELAYTRPSYSGSLLYYVWRSSSNGSLGSIEFEVTYEATHHGPTSNRVPVVFVELGSSEREWGIREGHLAWATAIRRFMDEGSICSELAVGFGGSHYPERFTRMTLDRGVCFGHIIPRYALKNLDPGQVSDIARKAVESSVEDIDRVYIEEKAAQSAKIKAIVSVLDDLGVEYVKL